MLLLHRERPKKERILQALVRRGLPEAKEELIRIQQGFAGESYVDRLWTDMNLDEPYFLLHDLQIDAHQIDTVFLCSKFLLIVEIKNIAGRIDFDDAYHQFTRTLEDGTVKGFRNPLDQARRHQRFLRTIITKMPIYYAVVLAFPKTIIGRVPPSETIIHSSGLEFHIKKLLTQHKLQITQNELEKTAFHLKTLHTPQQIQMNIEKTQLRQGVLCENCHYQNRMYYQRGRFICPHCAAVDEGNLVKQALQDYSLLFSNTIKNAELRKFLQIQSSHAMKRLLVKLDIPYTGHGKGRVYNCER